MSASPPVMLLLVFAAGTALAAGFTRNRPQWGGSSLRHNAATAAVALDDWDTGKFERRTGKWHAKTARNIRWVAPLGSQSYATPVVADEMVYIGTNNGSAHLARYPADVDLACLLAFRAADGQLVWQYSSEKLDTGRHNDWPLQGMCSTPAVEGDRMWLVTNRCELMCLDTAGFLDGEDDGPAKLAWVRLLQHIEQPAKVPDHAPPEKTLIDRARDGLRLGKLSRELRQLFARRGVTLPDEIPLKEEMKSGSWGFTTTPLGKSLPAEFRIEFGLAEQVEFDGVVRRKTKLTCLNVFQSVTAEDREADVVWRLDMIKELGVYPHNMSSSSPTIWGNLVFAVTGNGVASDELTLPAPDAPSFIAVDKRSGELVWSDNSPGANVLHGQWSSPAAGVLGGVPQVIFPGGDGWLYSFHAERHARGKPELLWKFDCNPKASRWSNDGRGTRNPIVAMPVIHEGRVYICVGDDPDLGEGQGHLYCLDPTRRGDVSAELVVRGMREIVPHRRVVAVDESAGEKVVANGNSAVIWHYDQFDINGNGEIEFEEQMHRSVSNPVIRGDVLIVPDFSGLVHCLNAKTGRPHWTCDLLAACWSSPLLVNDRVYIPDEDGDIAILQASADHTKSLDGDPDPARFDFGDPRREINMGNSCYASPVLAHGVLYVATRTHLFAIAADD